MRTIQDFQKFQFKFQFLTSVKQNEFMIFCGLLCESKNNKYFAVWFVDNFHLLNDCGKTIIHLKTTKCFCCFSEDSKYSAIVYYNSKKRLYFLMLFNLNKKKTVWVKQLPFKYKDDLQHSVTLNFYGHQIVILAQNVFKVYALDGQQYTFRKIENFNLFQSQIKLSENLMLFSQKFSAESSFTYVHLFSHQSHKSLNVFRINQNALKIIYMNKFSFISIPTEYQKIFILRRASDCKILRKLLVPKQDKTQYIGSSLIDFKLYLVNWENYIKVNFSTGQVSTQNIDIFAFGSVRADYQGKNFHFINLEEIWKQNKFITKITIDFYEFQP